MQPAPPLRRGHPVRGHHPEARTIGVDQMLLTIAGRLQSAFYAIPPLSCTSRGMPQSTSTNNSTNNMIGANGGCSKITTSRCWLPSWQCVRGHTASCQRLAGWEDGNALGPTTPLELGPCRPPRCCHGCGQRCGRREEATSGARSARHVALNHKASMARTHPPTYAEDTCLTRHDGFTCAPMPRWIPQACDIMRQTSLKRLVSTLTSSLTQPKSARLD